VIVRELVGPGAARPHHLYGLRLRTEWPLPYPRRPGAYLAEVNLYRGSPSDFSNAIEEARVLAAQTTWTRGVALANGQTYLRWPDRFEFLVSIDGRAIAARPLRRGFREAFHTYLLGQALSFALIRQGFDPLHATTVAVDGAGVAFLGESGFGKSSLGAAFVQAGHRLLTDDLLVLSPCDCGFMAHPGPPRIKLFPVVARRIMGPGTSGAPIANMTAKLVIPLDERQAFRSPVPLKAIYVLVSPARARDRVTIRRVSTRQACLALIENAFNTAVTDPGRLSRQLEFAASVAATLPVKRIAYPRSLGVLPIVRDAILADLSRR
jgi:hypothetical protein